MISGIGTGKRGKRHKSGSIIAGGSKVDGAGRAGSRSAVNGEGGDEEPEEDDDDQQDNLRDNEDDAELRQKEEEAQRYGHHDAYILK